MTGFKFAYYRKEDWDRFLSLIDDREKMPDTWEEWRVQFLKAKLAIMSQGYEVIEVVVDLDLLVHYCKVLDIKNDGEARAQFVVDEKNW